tara:strand:+ start:20 stop:364 length:345 start_codon:yes stop_codon:yes gene_type:complete
MDSKPRYTGDDYFYEIEEDFLKELEGLHPKYGSSIIKHLDGIVQEIAEDKILTGNIYEDEAGMVAGVVGDDEPLFYIVEFINYKNVWPLFHKLNVIESDQYLDYINLQKKIEDE